MDGFQVRPHPLGAVGKSGDCFTASLGKQLIMPKSHPVDHCDFDVLCTLGQDWGWFLSWKGRKREFRTKSVVGKCLNH